MGGGGGAGLELDRFLETDRGDGDPPMSPAPQWMQNLLFPLTGLPQLLHDRVSSFEPHRTQLVAPSGFSSLQFEQIISAYLPCLRICDLCEHDRWLCENQGPASGLYFSLLRLSSIIHFCMKSSR